MYIPMHMHVHKYRKTHLFILMCFCPVQCHVFIIQAVSASQAAIATATDPHNRGAGVGGKEGGGEAMTVQQILMPPDTDFLSSFYEAAEVGEGG